MWACQASTPIARPLTPSATHTVTGNVWSTENNHGGIRVNAGVKAPCSINFLTSQFKDIYWRLQLLRQAVSSNNDFFVLQPCRQFPNYRVPGNNCAWWKLFSSLTPSQFTTCLPLKNKWFWTASNHNLMSHINLFQMPVLSIKVFLWNIYYDYDQYIDSNIYWWKAVILITDFVR